MWGGGGGVVPPASPTPFLSLDQFQIFDDDISESSLPRLPFMPGHKVFNEQVCHDYLRDSLQFSNDGDHDVPKAHDVTIGVPLQ
jgi:hypothetical protein